MSRIGAWFATAALALTLLVQLTAHWTEPGLTPARAGTITGRVVIERGTELIPLRRATVTLSRAAQRPLHTATDQNGAYRFDDLADGKYRVSAGKAGFVPAAPDSSGAEAAAESIEVAAGVTRSVDFRMQRGAVFEGRFLDDSGRPVARLQVNAEAIPNSGATSGEKPRLQSASTDDLGRFRVHTLPPGRYRLHATPPPPASGNKLFYPSTEITEDATVFTVAPGQTFDHLEFTVATAEPSRIAADAMAAQERETDNAPVAPGLSSQVSGRVVRSDTAVPVPGSTVRLSTVAGALLRTAWPGPDGEFVFNRLPPGEFLLNAAADRLIGADASIVKPTGAGIRLTLKDNERVRQDLRLMPTSAIEGRVVDEFGDPVPGISLTVTQRPEVGGPSRPITGPGFKNTGMTDDRGWFRVFGLPPGDYLLLSLPEPIGRSGPSPFTRTYYPGVPSPDGAIPIHIEGLDVYDANIRLVAVGTTTISGLVVGPAGRPVPNARVSLFATENSESFGVSVADAVTGPDGRFGYQNIPEGPYVLRASAPAMAGSSPVTVVASTEADRRPVTLMLRPYMTARGRVVFDDVKGLQPAKRPIVFIRILPTDLTVGPAGTGASALVDPQGNFAVSDLAWHGVIVVSREIGGWVLARVTHQGRDMTDVPFDFQSADVEGLEVVLTNRVGRLSGTVVAGQPVQPTVFVFGADGTSAPYLTRTTQTVFPGRDGSFESGNLLPGRYYVAAVSARALRPEPAWLLGLRSSASIVTVTEGQTTNVKVSVVK